METTESKLNELIELAEKENENALLAILYAIQGARCSNTELILAKCVADAVKHVLLPLMNDNIISNN